MRDRLVPAALSLALACGAGPAAAQAPEDPDWPCVQRKVPHLAVAQLWSGPPVPDGPVWREDAEVTHLVSLAAARRTGIDALAPLLAVLGPEGGRSRAERLVAVFAGAFQTIDRERSRVIEGIGRFARKQRGLAGQIDRREDQIREAQAAAAPEDHDALDRIEEMQDQQSWDIRIYQDRQQTLAYVCETPVILERRAFALARLVEAELARE
jgi:hypothetical protein